jgi:hypothetical protein
VTDAEDPWGRVEPSAVAEPDLAPLPPALASIAAALESGERLLSPEGGRSQCPGPHDLPEVQTLAADGCEPLAALQLGSDVGLLPTVWPPAHGCWVRDRVPDFAVVSHCGDETFIEPELRNPGRRHWELARSARSVGRRRGLLGRGGLGRGLTGMCGGE